MPLHQFDYILAMGVIFAFLDAWNIGANDVANSWATSVGSRSVTYVQAMVLASIMEFSGCIGVGARVAETIRTKIVKTDLYAEDPTVLMLGMLCAVTASSLYLTVATRIGLPVSTTHSIMGAVIGMGVASVGANGVQWIAHGSGTAVINGGVVSVFLAWIIMPAIAGCIGAIIFTLTKYIVLLRKNPAWKALLTVPVYFGVTAMLLTMLLLWKGGSYKVTLSDGEIAGTIVGVGVAFGLLIAVTLTPWLYRKVIKNDWQIKWYHIPMGLLLLRRADPPAVPDTYHGGIRNFYEGHLTREQLEALRARRQVARVPSNEEAPKEKHAASDEARSVEGDPCQGVPERKGLIGSRPEGKWHTGPVLFWFMKKVFFNAVDKDVISMQHQKSVIAGDVEEMHAHASHYDNTAEYMFTFLQVLTACTASFTHGANDVSNAIGPFATIYDIWKNGSLPAKNQAQVPVWILAFGGVSLALGVWTYSYNIMKNLGNRITLHSPSRGFSMELASACTVVMATRLKLPVSTTQCITGATVGVGLCNGTWRSINWRMVAWIYMGWIITLPVTSILSGCIMGIIINAPRWGYSS